ncbi:MAG TPA: 2-oxoglutarate dehydrogenase E1 component, partial [Chthonomonadaceae bacterium]|nr:2-oxoglutarate dehydrogenase E1 component [Chthonomonadaceae bacterium]
LPASVVGGPIAEETSNAAEAIDRLREIYSGTIGYEDEHIQNKDERYWLRNSAESREFFRGIDAARKQEVLERLTEVESFERFLHKTFVNAKRFSIEGTDMLVPILDEIIHSSATAGTEEVVLGMAHRGRLNVLAHILGKPYAKILSEFEGAKHEEGTSVAGRGTQGWSGDVKYHLGHRRAFKGNGAPEITLTLVPNPSHLEFVNPVVEGSARAAQDILSEPGPPVQDVTRALAVAIHGDAAFPGQGIVAETLNMCRLEGYGTGGTLHIIVNNQIGFMTVPEDDRSTTYASDLAKGFEIPIVHVNADDPVACIAAARMAHAYRERFHKDFLIDLIGYRRYGHNEGEEPSYTQPMMYEVIPDHPRVRELWEQRLTDEGVVTHEQAATMVNAAYTELQDELTAARTVPPKPVKNAPSDLASLPSIPQRPETSVPAARLQKLNSALYSWPEGFEPNGKLERLVFKRRREDLTVDHKILWGHAEALAFASILTDGTPIRLTGQDCQPGTFGHRHAVIHDPRTGETYTPLQNLPDARASFAIYNSPLSENAALGFEYGYSIHAPGTLVVWEAQFGDFANGAQVIIDQFLVSGSAKWRQAPGLVMLLPHGYEGQGPEHSSARLERFLQLAATDNIHVANCTTPAQYFHLLRRQAAMIHTDPRPLIVMTPKSLLKDTTIGSSLADLTTGAFQPVIRDAVADRHPDRITRLALCSGKVYVELARRPSFAEEEQVAAVRIEELYPFPADDLLEVIGSYPNLEEIVWLQEEPANMGAWSFVAPGLRELFHTVRYVGRPASASPAEGSKARHDVEQARILAEAICGPQASSPVRRETGVLQGAANR